MIKRIPIHKFREILSNDIVQISDRHKDEMAIPSYLHRNFMVRWLMWKRYEHISIMSAFSNDLTVLEFGCGIGVFLPELDQRCGKVYAIDIFPEYAMLLSAEFDLNIHFINRLSEVPNNSLDIIIAADVLEHLNDDELIKYFGIFSKKLKANGRLIMSGPTENIIYKIGRVIAGFSDKGDYHHTNINKLINVTISYFDLNRTKYLPFRFPPFLFKICEFEQLRTKHSSCRVKYRSLGLNEVE